MRNYNFNIEDVLEARKIISDIERKWEGKAEQRFKSGLTWNGILGQRAFKILYPEYLGNGTKDDEIDDFDFIHPISKRTIEVKTSGGNYDFAPSFSLTVNKDQYDDKNYDIFVGCYYNLKTNNAVVFGWQLKSFLDSHPEKKFYNYGDKLYSNKGNLRFIVKDKCGIFDFPAGILEPMESLLTYI